VVRDDWLTIWWDATGHSVMGPVTSEEDVWHIARIAIDALKQITAQNVERVEQ
jgi:hypothetical protein